MFARVVGRILAGDELEEMAMDVDGVRHHRVVDERDAHPFHMAESDRLRAVGQLHPVERPHIAFHVRGQMNVERPGRRADILIRLQRAQVGIGQHAMIDILQPRGPVGGAIGGHGGQGRDARSHRHLRRDRGVEHLHAVPGHAFIGGLGQVNDAPLPHVHAGHVHPHILHRQQRTGAQRRDGGDHADLRRKRRADEAGAVDGFGDQSVGGCVGRLDDHVIGFGDADLELVGFDRLDMLAIALHHGHGQAGQADVEIGHGRSVDDAQADTLARRKQPGPVFRRAMAVDEEAVGGAGDVRNIGRVHPHRAPFDALLQGLVLALEQIGERLLLHIIIAAHLLEPLELNMRVDRRPVGQDDHMFSASLHRINARGIDDDGAIMAHRLLHAGMAVIPVGARLLDRKFIMEGFAGADAGEADARNAVHLKGEDQAVPVDRRVFLQPVGDGEADILAFFEPDQRRWQRAIDGDRMGRAAAGRKMAVSHRERDRLA